MESNSEIEHLFLKAIETLNDKWIEAQKNDPLIGTHANLRRPISELLHKCVNENEVIFEQLINNVLEIIPRMFGTRIDGVRSAVFDYLILAATKHYFERNLFREDDISDASRLFLEDLSLEWFS